MEQLYEVESYLSPAEAAYIDNPDPEEQECILFGWRYECAGVLLWAAGGRAGDKNMNKERGGKQCQD